ncbi:hypothetical protein, partial [Bacillus subtilis]|uniref:hypothetical protein n=1 Tax=Bacillus subtilis TaxID=1423 RepID=UPI003C1A9583
LEIQLATHLKMSLRVLRQYLLSLAFAESEEVTELDVEKDLGEDYSLAYGSQLLCWFHRFGKLGKDVVEIVAVEWTSYKFFDLVDIVHNGERREES